MALFQTRCFFLHVNSPPYDGPVYNREVRKAMLEKQRTKTFHAFQEYIREVGLQ